MGVSLRITDAMSILSGNGEVTEFEHGEITILADDGRDLFSIRLLEDGRTIEVRAGGSTVKSGGKVLDNQLEIRPVSTNFITISRSVYGG